MLVLSRKKGESIVIGDDIELTVLAVEGDTIKLGIKAPKHVDILRKEILVSVQENNESAALDPKEIIKMMQKKSSES
ncbi:carbon storage regulator CsrA [Saccharibacillus alkalitolerans]|uniref:Translational regulator CsrA n=1 Tax=Saccharibacillus alkalitolerans TaxID=2705290 RepID=A0ABX0FD61_9BACL|nr:carbon storage regulator CsrA [Saccharibacillus alkalitolerans]NGZ76122.1 carbon storage regulator CsrA [Saccharibacillus alkalitolerans]